MDVRRKITNFVLFEAGWPVLVLAAAWGKLWAAVLYSACLLAIHFGWVSRRRALDARLLLACVLIGAVGDSAVAAIGWIRYEAAWPFAPWLTPLWMILLWVNFSTTLSGCLAWLRDLPVVSALLGLLGGPLAYWAGGKLGALAITGPFWPTLLFVGINWALVMPLLFALLRRFEPAAASAPAPLPTPIS